MSYIYFPSRPLHIKKINQSINQISGVVFNFHMVSMRLTDPLLDFISIVHIHWYMKTKSDVTQNFRYNAILYIGSQLKKYFLLYVFPISRYKSNLQSTC